MATELPRCYNRLPFQSTVRVQKGWSTEFLGNSDVRVPLMVTIPDPMSKECQQHGPMGEAFLHPEDWKCEGCVWKPTT